MRNLTLALLLALPAAPAAAQGGALPKGDPTVDTGKKSAPKGEDPKRHNCYLDLANPPGGNGAWTKSGSAVFLLAQTGVADEGAKGGKKKAVNDDPKAKYTLFKISPKTKKVEAILSLDHRGLASLLTHNNPVDAVSAVAFIGQGAGCYEGEAGVVSISFKKKTDKAVLSAGSFQLVQSSIGRQLVDTTKSSVLETDPVTFQTRVSRRVPKGERALWYDAADRSLVTWHDDGKQRGLVRYAGDEDATPKRLALKKNDRVVQQGGRFAVATFDQKKNTIKILELADWTKVKKPSRFTLSLPPANAVAMAAVDAHFEKRLALVYGSNLIAKQKWQRLFVYDYGTMQQIGVQAVTGAQYLSWAGIDPTGSYVLVEVRDFASRQTVGVKLFSVAKKQFEDLDLTVPE